MDHQVSARITLSISVCYLTLLIQVTTMARTESPKCLLTLPLKGWNPESFMLAGDSIRLLLVCCQGKTFEKLLA